VSGIEYLEALDWLYNVRPRFGLPRSSGRVPTRKEMVARQPALAEAMDSVCPGWRDVKVVHVTGTSGKGSTVKMLERILSTRYKVGALTSPHVRDFRERITVNGGMIPGHSFASIADRHLMPLTEERFNEGGEAALPGYQELILLAAFRYFLDEGAEWAVVEAGVGGYRDSTNILTPQASCVTNVEDDHAHLIGPTLEDIAIEKAGVIKPGVPFFTTETKEPIISIFRKVCAERGAPFHHVVPDVRDGILHLDGLPLKVGARGCFQLSNAALAGRVALHLGMDAGDAAGPLEGFTVPYRTHELEPGLFLDIAHNPFEMRSLANTFAAQFPDRKKVLVLGVSDKKDLDEMLAPFVGIADEFVFTQASYRGIDAGELAAAAKRLGVSHYNVFSKKAPREALTLARELADHDSIILITGSTFVVDEATNPDTEAARLSWDYGKEG